MKFSLLTLPVDLLKLRRNVFSMIKFKIGNSGLRDFYEICLKRREACKPNCFKLGMILDTTRQLYDSSLNGLDLH